MDIETSPNQAFVWGLFDQTISTNHIIESSSILCYSAKWLDDREVSFDSIMKSKKKKMLTGIHKLIDQADVIITYNGARFDLPILNKEFLLHEMPPPAPYKQVDLLKVARNRFRFVSNKLDFVSQALGVGKKTAHAGFQLWVDCMNKVPAAWKKMEEYNKQDVVLLEKVYRKMLPWIPNHPNMSLYDSKICCTRCGESDQKKIQSRGVARTLNVTYKRYQCQTCGGWMHGDKAVNHVKPVLKGIH